MGIFDKAKEFAQEHSEQVGQGLDAAGDFVDEKTGGQYSGQVDQAQEFLRGQVGGEAAADEQAPEQPA